MATIGHRGFSGQSRVKGWEGSENYAKESQELLEKLAKNQMSLEAIGGKFECLKLCLFGFPS